MGSLSGEATLLVSFLLPFSLGSTLKGKNLLLYEIILSFKGLLLLGVSSSREVNWNLQICPLFNVNGAKTWQCTHKH